MKLSIGIYHLELTLHRRLDLRTRESLELTLFDLFVGLQVSLTLGEAWELLRGEGGTGPAQDSSSVSWLHKSLAT